MPKANRLSCHKNSASCQKGVTRTDIFMSIKVEHMNNIANGTKNHEYRKYLLPASVQHIWFYTTAPASAIQYVAKVSPGKKPGEVAEDGGVGNADFNAGKKASKFAYEILKLWKLQEPITLQEAIAEGILKGPPQKYTYVFEILSERWPLEGQIEIISRQE